MSDRDLRVLLYHEDDVNGFHLRPRSDGIGIGQRLADGGEEGYKAQS